MKRFNPVYVTALVIFIFALCITNCDNGTGGGELEDPADPNLPTLVYVASMLPAGKINEPYSANLGIAELPPEAEPAVISYTVVSGSLPAGLTLSSNGTLSGTPTTGSSGTRTFGVRASADGYNSKTAVFNLSITADNNGKVPKIAFEYIGGYNVYGSYPYRGDFIGAIKNIDLIVYDAAGMTSIPIFERTNNGTGNSQTRVIPISGPGTYHLTQEIRNSSANATSTKNFQYTISAYDESLTINYTGAYVPVLPGSTAGTGFHYFVYK